MRAQFALGLAFALTACTYSVDEVSLSIDGEGSGNLIGKGVALTTESDTELQQQIDDLQSCGAVVTSDPESDRVNVDVSIAFTTTDQLDQSLACANLPWETSSISVQQEAGWIWQSYTTRLVLSRPAFWQNSQGEYLAVPLIDVPKAIVLTVPGDITDVAAVETILGLSASMRETSRNTMAANFFKDKGEEAERQSVIEKLNVLHPLDVGSVRELEARATDEIVLTIESEELAIEIATALLPVAFLMGIGITIFIMRRRRT